MLFQSDVLPTTVAVGLRFGLNIVGPIKITDGFHVASSLNLQYLSVSGWTEHIQRLLHPENQLLQAHQPQCQVQQRQEPGLHPSRPPHC